MIVNQQQVQFIPSKNQLLMGAKGPLCARLNLDFSAPNAHYDLDMQQVQSTNNFDFCQTMFIDNSAGGAPIVVTIPASGQVIFAKAGTQGYYNVVCPNPIKMSFDSSGGQLATILLLNVAIPGATWSAN
jgi:hypothetical protein